MAIDPRRLRPSELCRLLNSTPLGEVTSDRQLHRHRMRAGHRIGDRKLIDLLRYAGWLMELRHCPKSNGYEQLKGQSWARNRALSSAGRDIDKLPAVVNPERKERAATDFRFFCEAYFPAAFKLAWSPDHLKVISKIERRLCTPAWPWRWATGAACRCSVIGRKPIGCSPSTSPPSIEFPQQDEAGPWTNGSSARNVVITTGSMDSWGRPWGPACWEWHCSNRRNHRKRG